MACRLPEALYFYQRFGSRKVNATETLNAALDAGIRLTVEGSGLVLEAHEAPPKELLNALRRDKAKILNLLNQSLARESDTRTEEHENPELHGLSVEELQEGAGEDWQTVQMRK